MERTAVALLPWEEFRLVVFCDDWVVVDPVECWAVDPEVCRAVVLDDWVALLPEEVLPEAELPLRTVDDEEDVLLEDVVVRDVEAVVPPLRTGVEVVRTVVNPLLVTLELDTVVSRRSMLVRPDWEEPVVVVLAPEEVARIVVEVDVERAEEEEPLAVVWARSGTVPARRRMQAAAAEILCKLLIVL
ncbi:MAG: hypothetical protein IKX37_01775 [Bacteroidales bacterium]|nr:hypothetical protein [Bacteroidales bacterium]